MEALTTPLTAGDSAVQKSSTVIIGSHRLKRASLCFSRKSIRAPVIVSGNNRYYFRGQSPGNVILDSRMNNPLSLSQNSPPNTNRLDTNTISDTIAICSSRSACQGNMSPT